MTTKEEVLEAIANMSVLELSELLSEFEEKFGVTAAAPVAAVAAAPENDGNVEAPGVKLQDQEHHKNSSWREWFGIGGGQQTEDLDRAERSVSAQRGPHSLQAIYI